jgi:CubicO group peptidase (beta-lactamase class C family)
MGRTTALEDARLAELARECDVPGASLAVLADDEIFLASTGVLSTETGVAATTDSAFQLASITKVFTATAVMRLVEAGKVDLDAPVRDVVPGFRVADAEVTERVTPRHLLTHTSGIAGDFFPDTGRGDDAIERYVGLCADLGQDMPFGATMSYSNSGYVILGRVIECASGLTWDGALRELIFEPLGLRRTFTLPEHGLRLRTAWGHVTEPGGSPEPAPFWGPSRGLGPAGWVCASAEDVVTFARAFLDDGGDLLAPQSAAEMLRPQVDVPDRWSMADHCGLGWWLHDWDGRRVFGHDGTSPTGQASFLRVVPDAGIAIALLANGGRTDELGRRVYHEVLPGLCGIDPPAWPSPAVDGAAAYDGIPGRYERLGVRTDVEARHDGLRGTIELIEPLVSQLPPQPPLEFSIHPSTAGDGVYVAQTDPNDDTWWPLVFVELDGERYLHSGGRALHKVA